MTIRTTALASMFVATAFASHADEQALGQAIDKAANDAACAIQFGEPYDAIAEIAWENLEVAASDAGIDPEGDEYEMMKINILGQSEEIAASPDLGSYCEQMLQSGS